MRYEQLAAAWLDAVEKQKQVDYGDPQSVAGYNACTDSYRDIAKKIDQAYPEKIMAFADLLDSEDADVRVICAVCLLELTHYPEAIEEKALEVIRAHAESSWDAFGYQLWLEDWQQGRIQTQYTQA